MDGTAPFGRHASVFMHVEIGLNRVESMDWRRLPLRFGYSEQSGIDVIR